MIIFDAQPIAVEAAEGEESPRTISGVAVPWGKTATVMSGEKVMFERGAFDLSAKPKLLEGHDMGQLRGVVTDLEDADDGLRFTARFANTRASNDAIALVKLGAYDSVSVGAQPTKYKYDKAGVMVVSAADIVEISLVAMPAFKDAVITEIAAQADPEGEPTTQHEGETQVSDQTPVVEAAEPQTIPTQPLLVAAAPKKPFTLPSPAEYVSKIMAGGAEAQEFFAAIKAAAPDVVTTDTPGILPEPIVGPVYNNFRGLRPVVDAIGVKAMPGGGKVFRRPEVTTHTTIGASNGENVALDSGTFVVSNNNVTKGVYGGYVKLSEEDMDWTEPEVVGLLLDDMARIYAHETDNVAADNLLSGSTVTRNFDESENEDPTYWVQWVYGAARDILEGSNGNLPSHFFVSPNKFQQLGRLEDGQGRPLFPQVGPMNAYGSLTPASVNGSVFGLTLVVDRNFAGDTMIVGDPTGFEIFEQQKGAIQVEAADGSLSRIIKFRGYFATLMIDASKFVKAALV